MKATAMTDERAQVTRIDDLIVDEDTGEIIATPEEVRGDRLDWTIQRGREAMEQIKAWEAALRAYKAAAGALLERQDLARYHSAAGLAETRSRTTRTVDRATFEEVALAEEWEPSAIERLTLRAATKLDPDIVAEHAAALAERVIEIKTSTWTQFGATRKAAPKVSRVTRYPTIYQEEESCQK